MTWRRGILLVILGILILVTCQESFAKCANREVYYCTSVVFKKEMPELNINNIYGKEFCSGSIVLSNGSEVTVVFMDKEPCPTPGSRLSGHLSTLCQDTGQWTNAIYSYSKESDFCNKNYDDSLQEAQVHSTQIQLGMTRAQVRELLKDYVFLGGSFTEQYYLHPDIVLEVSFDEPNGTYNQENKVKSPTMIKKMVLPQP